MALDSGRVERRQPVRVRTQAREQDAQRPLARVESPLGRAALQPRVKFRAERQHDPAGRRHAVGLLSAKGVKSILIVFDMARRYDVLFVTMQAKKLTQDSVLYPVGMQTGRPATVSAYAVRRARARRPRSDAGSPKPQVAEQMGVTQTAYAVWERHPVALRPEQIEKLAEVLSVPVGHLFGREETNQRGKGTDRQSAPPLRVGQQVAAQPATAHPRHRRRHAHGPARGRDA